MKKLTAVILALVLVFAMPLSIFAADPTDAGTAGSNASADGNTNMNDGNGTNFGDTEKGNAANSANTKVFLKAGEKAVTNLSATVPLFVTLAVKSDKTIAAPTNYSIANTGAININVSGITTSLADTNVSDGSNGYTKYTFAVTAPTAENPLAANALYLTLKSGANGTAKTLAATTLSTATTDWNITSGTALTLTFDGSVGPITALNTTAVQVFTITYTITAGTAA